ncbi:MAG: guanine deaminase [Hydrocarboniphaga sp.]|uniref:guanine deaminase n=1 Tax=Hydrocarboniphaga sp. TaxID=2033016 RepID=UPI0026201D53|nr:guanine deaminase [Hydrocarboniphaga sp.]MDB5971739.1 guanine deaminase [Hydrocarboniphaga sp.]
MSAAAMQGLAAHRGALLHFLSDPGEFDDAAAYEYFEDGLLLIEDGKVSAVGLAPDLLAQLPAGTPLTEHSDRLLMPGFIDTHIHVPQTDMIASGGRQLLDWLNDYTFPTEARFADYAHGREVAEFFLDELLRNGTSTAQVFGSVHKASVDSFFDAAAERGLRMIAGKSLMDRNCPDYVRDTAESGERDTRELIERWHGVGRLSYAITPRFAPTSTEQQLESAGRLAREYPTVYIHSHLAENHAEIAWVKQLFPWSRSYLDVYEHYGLLRERATYAHCIYLDTDDRHRMAASGACAACSPTSNLYLGSGLFDFAACDRAGMGYALATDVGGGTSFSMLRTMSEAYKVAQMQNQRLPPLRAFYLATLGGARVLHLQDRIGSFRVGNEADFIVLDLAATPLMKRRIANTQTLNEKLLVLMTLGDDRLVAQTYIRGLAVLP